MLAERADKRVFEFTLDFSLFRSHVLGPKWWGFVDVMDGVVYVVTVVNGIYEIMIDTRTAAQLTP